MTRARRGQSTAEPDLTKLGITHLDANESHLSVHRTLVSLLDEIIIHLAREKDDPLNLIVVNDRVIIKDGLKACARSHLGQRGARRLVIGYSMSYYEC